LAAGWLQPHKTSRAEIRELWEIVDWQYGIAYNAALKLCTILLYATGYKPAKGAMAHSRTLNALPHTLGTQRQGDADYLEGCRQKRNTVEYDHAGGATHNDAAELIAFGHELRAEVLTWLREKHPELAPE
jgi:hypothetical protein